MKKNIYHLSLFCAFMLSGLTAGAQTGDKARAKLDSLYTASVFVRDSIVPQTQYNVSLYKYDTGHLKLLKEKLKSDAIHLDLQHKQQVLDSFHYVMLDSNNELRIVKRLIADSIPNRKKFLRGHSDSLYSKNKIYELRNKLFSVQADSLHRLSKSYVRLDSIRTTMALRQKLFADTIHKRIKMQQLDNHLRQLKLQLRQAEMDSARRYNRKMKPRIITVEVNTQPSPDVKVDDLSRNIIVKTTADNKVRLSVQVYDEEKEVSNQEVLDKMGIALLKEDNTVSVVYKDQNKTAPRPKVSRSSNIFASKRTAPPAPSRSNASAKLTLFIPAKTKLTIANTLANVEVQSDMESIYAEINNGDLVMKNAVTAVIKSTNGSVTAGKITYADINLSGCNFACKTIDKLLITSKHSVVNFDKATNVVLNSTSDNYAINQAGELKGDKKFGNIQVNELARSFELTGFSSDVHIGHISIAANLVKIDSKYADLQLPVSKLYSYSVSLSGSRSKVSAPFEKQLTKNTAPTIAMENSRHFSTGSDDPGAYQTKFQINCSSCAVDFK